MKENTVSAFLIAMQCICISICYPQPQTKSVEFKHITIEDGLSQNSIFCIVQDRKGFMWFGTEEGLNKYDGYQFKIYRSSSRDQNSLKNDYIYSLFEDQTGIIWIGTRNGGLSRFDPVTGKFKNYLNDPNNKNSISDNVSGSFMKTIQRICGLEPKMV